MTCHASLSIWKTEKLPSFLILQLGTGVYYTLEPRLEQICIFKLSLDPRPICLQLNASSIKKNPPGTEANSSFEVATANEVSIQLRNLLAGHYLS